MADKPTSAGQSSGAANLQKTRKEGLTVKEAAKRFNVSERSIYMAAKILRSGNQEICRAVERGEMTLHKALQILYPKPPKAKDWGNELKAVWLVASPEERADFCAWLRGLSEMDGHEPAEGPMPG
jgi:hypothetical protein